MRHFLVTIGLLGLIGGIRAQGDPFARPILKALGLEDGLPHRSNLSAAYDRDSMLWLSTEASLCRYDGYQITSFAQLPQSFRGVLRRNEDSLLYARPLHFPDSVEVFNPITLRSFGARLGRPEQGAFAGAVQVNGGPLYYARGTAIYRYRADGTMDVVHRLAEPVAKRDLLVAADDDGYLLYRNRAGAFETSPATTFSRPPGTSALYKLHLARNGDLWVGTADGLFRKPHGGEGWEPGPELSTGRPINIVFEDGKGHLIFGHYHPHLLRFQGIISYYDGVVRDLQWLQDHDDRIIEISGSDFFREMNVATHGGFVRVNFPDNEESPFRRYLYDPTVSTGGFGHVMRGFTADEAGNVYVNKDTRQPYWFRVRAGSGQLDTLVMRDNHGQTVDNFGCGTNMLSYKGDVYGSSCTIGATDTAHVYRYRPADASWHRWQLPKLGHRIRWMMRVSGRSDILIATQGIAQPGGGLWFFSPASGTFDPVRLSGKDRDILGYPKSGVEDANRGLIWFASTGGLYRFTPRTGAFLRIRPPDRPDTEFSDVIVRPDGSLLLGTFKRGLLVYQPATGEFSRVGGIPSDDDPGAQSASFRRLPSNDVAALRMTPDGSLLVSTFNGLALFPGDGGPVETFTTLDGLTSNEFNTPSLFYHAADERWYAGGINGFVSFRTRDLVRPPSPYAPLLLRTRFLDERQGREQTQRLLRGGNQLLTIRPSVAYFSLEYTVPDYGNGRAPRYQTFLEGYDPRWRRATATPSVRYTRLPPGEYTFRLRARDGEGRMTPNPVEINVWVLKPWYETGWFYAALSLSIIGLVILAVYLRDRRLRREYRAQRQLQEVELRALRQQINPHFISNAMNAIRDFVFERDPDTAADYLTDFSRLMRLFLESSRNRFTSVADETELLERYIRLEQLRYRGKFEYVFELDEDIDPEMEEVPSLLLQPIIENAINHGLRHLESGGLLTVAMRYDEMDEDVLICTVTDNGIGRKLAAEIKAKSAEDHVSRATQILADRQRLLKADGTIQVTITTTDTFPTRRHTGTQVAVRIESAGVTT